MKRLGDGEGRVLRQLIPMGAYVFDKGPDQLDQSGVFRRARAERAPPLGVGENREILDRLHVPPADKRLLREWNPDFAAPSFFAVQHGLAIVGEIARTSRLICPDRGDSRNEDDQHYADYSIHVLPCCSVRLMY